MVKTTDCDSHLIVFACIYRLFALDITYFHWTCELEILDTSIFSNTGDAPIFNASSKFPS